MKKVLILAYDYPPYRSVAALRPSAWVEYFPDENIYPIIVTRSWDNIEHDSLDYLRESKSKKPCTTEYVNYTKIEAPYTPSLANKILLKFGQNRCKYLRKFFMLTHEIFQFLLPMGNKRNILKCADYYLGNNKVDVIIATGGPFILFRYAKILSKEHKTPWIADYRDVWSHFHETKKSFWQKIQARFEFKNVEHCDAISTVSETILQKIENLVGEKKHCINLNGYNDSLIEQTKGIHQQNDKLTISHAGALYDWHPIESFLKTLLIFKLKNPNFNFTLNFYGLNQSSRVLQFLDKNPELVSNINIYGRIENSEMIEKLRASNINLLFNYYAYMGTKIYDYLAVERFILFCYEDEPVAKELKGKYYNFMEEKEIIYPQIELVKQHSAGVVVLNEIHLLECLINLKNEFLVNKKVRCDTTSSDIYSRRNQTKKLADFIHENF